MFADPNSELVRQLTRIADAASAPHPSPWIEWFKTLASFAAGIFAAYLSDLLRTKHGAQTELNKMRKIVYYELGRWFIELHAIVGHETRLRKMRLKVWQNFGTYDGEQYMRDNPALYYQLSEGYVLKAMYYWCHRVDAGEGPFPDNGRTYGLTELKGPLRFISDVYRKNPIIRKNFKKFLSKGENALLKKAAGRYERVIPMEELVDSGLVRIVEDEQDGAIGQSKDGVPLEP
jgi:hypothetical protein